MWKARERHTDTHELLDLAPTCMPSKSPSDTCDHQFPPVHSPPFTSSSHHTHNAATTRPGTKLHIQMNTHPPARWPSPVSWQQLRTAHDTCNATPYFCTKPFQSGGESMLRSTNRVPSHVAWQHCSLKLGCKMLQLSLNRSVIDHCALSLNRRQGTLIDGGLEPSPTPEFVCELHV